MLTEQKIREAGPTDKRYRLTDGAGLYLEVFPTGRKAFARQYRWRGSQRKDYLGDHPALKLSAARLRAAEIGHQVKNGVDPRGGAENVTAPGRKPVEEADPGFVPVERRFETLVGKFIEKRVREGVADATADKLRWNLGAAARHFEARDVGEIKPADVLKLVEQVQATGRLEKARDIHRKLGQVFDYAIGLGLVDWNPAQMVRRAVVRAPGGKHPGVTDPRKVGELMRAIRGYTGQATTRAALMLSAYTVLRSGEMRPARWEEIDFDGAVWTVPGARMKGHYGDHLVPLSRQAVDTLTYLRECLGDPGPSDFLFPAPAYRDRYMSNATLNSGLRRLGYDTRQEHCHHGFRTTFSTNMNEQGWNSDWIERQLCHIEGNKVRGAYNRALYLPQRAEMMQAYADWLDEMEGHQ